VNRREVFEAVGRQNGNPVAARQTARGKRAGDGVGLALEIPVAEAAFLTSAQIDDRDLVEIASRQSQ
jgi:hypothetical protein